MADMNTILEQVTAEVARACVVAPATIEPDAALAEYGLDSARAMQLVLALEERFGIRIPDEAVPRLRTVIDVASLVEQLARIRRPTE
jgi:acyl carrier protein